MPATLAATALALGMLGNTILKLAVTLVIGRGQFRVAAASALAVMAVALGATLAVASQVRG